MRLLYHDEAGRVYKCTCCDKIQILFANVSMQQSLDEWLYFKESLEWMIYETPQMSETHRFSIKSGLGEMAIRLNRQQLGELVELIDGAAAMIELQDILEDRLR